MVFAGVPASYLQAAPIPCLGSQPLSGLIALASTGCIVGDKLVSDVGLTTIGTLAALDASVINVLTSITPQGEEVLTFVGGLAAVGGIPGGTLTGIINY